MPNRIIEETIRTSKNVNRMTDFEFRLWLYLITYVDDYGRGSADPAILKGYLFPLRDSVTKKNVEDGLSNLACIGLISLYEVDGESYLCFPKWGTHQRIQAKRSKFPEPPEKCIIHGDPPLSTVSHGESPLESNPIQSESNTKKKNTKKKFSPPSIDEIAAFCVQRNNGVDPKRFFDYYSAGNWKDSKGNQIINWKQKLIAVWEKGTPQKKEEQLPVYDASKNEELNDSQAKELLTLMGKI